jgi:hypothetical protein
VSSKVRLLLVLIALVPVVALVFALRRKPTVDDLARHRIRQLAYWQASLEQPVATRIGSAKADLIEYLTMDNQVNGFAGAPSPAKLTPEMRAAIEATLTSLPPKLASLVDDKLLGVFVVKGLGSSAYTDFVRDAQGHAVAAFVCLDVDALNRKANEWLTWKESSPFLPDAAWRIEGFMAESEQDTPEAALAFVLVHELAHVIAFDEDVHPLWSLAPRLVKSEEYPFMALSWGVDGDRFVRLAEKQTPVPGPIVYYKPSVERPSAASATSYYDWLAKTSFVTLYAATNPFDDFADSIATYVHTMVQKRPFEIRLFENNELKRTVVACWEEPRCAEKRRELEAFLEVD